MNIRSCCLAAGMLAAACVPALLAGCGSNIRETYYLKAYDPSQGATNFFRIKVYGSTSSSRTKFSVGFFDRSAVERLFGENLLSREYLGTDVQVFDDKGSYADIGARLTSARADSVVTAHAELMAIAGTMSERIAEMRTRLSLAAEEYKVLLDKLGDAATAVTDAETQLKTTPPTTSTVVVARDRLSTALGTVRAIRLAVDGSVIVRFLDGAGNEVDVSNQVQLIFVSTDAGRFTQALRDLVQSDKTRQQLLQVVLGPKIIEASQLQARLTASTSSVQARLTMLAARNTDIQAAGTTAEIQASLLQAANEAAGTAVTFKDASDLRIYVEGL